MKTPKRTIRQNIWGNWWGYVAGRRAVEFGTDWMLADIWLNDPDRYASIKAWKNPMVRVRTTPENNSK